MVNSRLPLQFGVLLLVGGAGCVEYKYQTGSTYTDVAGSIVVDPTSIDYGVLDPGIEAAEVVTVTNEGTAALDLSPLTLVGSSAFSISSDHMLSTLDPAQSTEFRVTYLATGNVEEGSVLVDSTDPVTPEVTVSLLGGLTPPTLQFDPDPLDFGYIAVGDADTEDLTLTNTGGSDLIISDLALDGDQFSVSLPSFPFTLAPGEETAVSVTYTPTAAGDATGTLTATSNADEDNVADLMGTSSTGPIAVCSVDPDTVTSHSDMPTWIGDESYDPSGATITTYDWTLISQPSHSTATMPTGTSANRRDFAWDLAGDYVGQLVVTNSHGQVSDPCTATLTATPSDDLWIEMYWTHSGDDMDLHLLEPGGSLDSWTSDCYYANCTLTGLDWGVRGDSTDNPSLDLDDIPGTGPENIRIESPSDGTYTVYVNDYPGSVYTGSNPVTVTIYIGGTVAYTDTKAISGEDDFQEFATVTFPGGTVTAH